MTRLVAGLICLSFLLGSTAQEATKRIELAKKTTEEILEDEGETIRVFGFVETSRTNATGIHFLNFLDSEFVCVTFARYVKDFEGPPSEIYREKWLEVSGEIENYRGTPQIKLLSPDQVKIVDAPPPPKPEEVTEMEEKEEPESEEPEKEPEPEKVVEEKPDGPVVEVIDGVPAVEWRKYFPEKPKGEEG